ncbi:MAG TPA: hypothetical protein VF747_06685 [Blastocatellia bacterium]
MSQDAPINDQTNRVNPLDELFGSGDIRVSLLKPNGEESGVVGVFKPIEPQHKIRYDQIVQKGFGGRKPKYDDGDRYAFPKVIKEIEGLTPEDCGGVEPVKWCQTTPKGFLLLKALMNGYWNQTVITSDDDAKK